MALANHIFFKNLIFAVVVEGIDSPFKCYCYYYSFLFFKFIGYKLSHWRIPGVLQRFSVAYFVVAMTELLAPVIYNKYKVYMPQFLSHTV